ncbi:hypothetical protein DBR06_SOUSAS27110013, partial [Sousa chinensis]
MVLRLWNGDGEGEDGKGIRAMAAAPKSRAAADRISKCRVWSTILIRTFLFIFYLVTHAGVFRGLVSTVSLSAESGKNEKGLPPNPKKQSPPKKSTPAATPAELFDNTTYKNLQHHDYSTYTFLDLNLELSKFRMLQEESHLATESS